MTSPGFSTTTAYPGFLIEIGATAFITAENPQYENTGKNHRTNPRRWLAIWATENVALLTGIFVGLYEQQLKSWYCEAEAGEWRNTNEIKKEYPSASILRDNRVAFNIKGNTYRLIVRINFHYQMMWIRFVGTHKEYDRIDANII